MLNNLSTISYFFNAADCPQWVCKLMTFNFILSHMKHTKKKGNIPDKQLLKRIVCFFNCLGLNRVLIRELLCSGLLHSEYL